MVTPANYRTVFELGLKSFPWSTVAHPLIGLIGGLVILWLLRKKTFYTIVGTAIASISAIIFILALISSVPEFITRRGAYANRKGITVEGVVVNFRQAPEIGPATESFSINGTSFSYNVLDGNPCFHNAPIHGGPIREGLVVRIRYDETCIQRVDVLQ